MILGLTGIHTRRTSAAHMRRVIGRFCDSFMRAHIFINTRFRAAPILSDGSRSTVQVSKGFGATVDYQEVELAFTL